MDFFSYFLPPLASLIIEGMSDVMRWQKICRKSIIGDFQSEDTDACERESDQFLYCLLL